MLDSVFSTGEQLTVAVSLGDARRERAVASALVEAGMAAREGADTVAAGAGRAAVLVTDDLAMLGEHGPTVLLARRTSDPALALQSALQAGAAFLPADASFRTIDAAVRAVAAGLVAMPAKAAVQLAGRVPPARPPRDMAAAQAAALTTREHEVLGLMAEGAANKSIARELGITVHTVKFHVAAILDKLDATGRTDAVAQGARLGLVLL